MSVISWGSESESGAFAGDSEVVVTIRGESGSGNGNDYAIGWWQQASPGTGIAIGSGSENHFAALALEHIL